jgi:hypothetical protein
MKECEDYTIHVNVSNKFNSESGVNIKVHHHHSPPYATPDDTYYTLYYGDSSLTVDLLNNNEYLEISLVSASVPPYPYYIIAGRKAKAKCTFDGEPRGPENSGTGALHLKDDFYTGGIWKVEEKDKDQIWELIIKEYNFDPQTDDVVIGSGPPA